MVNFGEDQQPQDQLMQEGQLVQEDQLMQAHHWPTYPLNLELDHQVASSLSQAFRIFSPTHGADHRCLVFLP